MYWVWHRGPEIKVEFSFLPADSCPYFWSLENPLWIFTICKHNPSVVVHASLVDLFPLCPWQKHSAAPLFCSLGQLPCPHLNALFPLPPATPQSAPSPRPRCGVHTRWAVSGCNFKWPCAQNKCRHSAMLKNRKSLNACYRNSFVFWWWSSGLF